MVMTLPVLWSGPPKRRWLRRLLGVIGLVLLLIGACSLVWPPSISMNGGPPFQWPASSPTDGDAPFHVHLGFGYWAWALSFVCAAAALWLRDREWASAEPRRATAWSREDVETVLREARFE